MTNIDPQVSKMLKEDIAQHVLREFGLSDSTPERQAAILAQMGDVIQDRIAIQVLRALPDHAKERFVALIDSDDIIGMYSHILPYIPNPDAFISQVIAHEVAAIKQAYTAGLSKLTAAPPQYV